MPTLLPFRRSWPIYGVTALCLSLLNLTADSRRQDELPPNAIWLESLKLDGIEQEWGNPHARASVDNQPLSIGGQSFRHGIGTHAASEWRLDLKGSATRFVASVGVDNEKKGQGSVTFEVWADEKIIAKTPVMHGGDAAVPMDVDLTGVKSLRLVVTDAGDGIDSDHADWGGAYLVLRPGATDPISTLSASAASEPTLPIWMGEDSPLPAIHGPRAVGATPGKPFLFRIPATGTAPLRFSADNLPAGVTLDPATGILSGSLKRPGTTTVDLTVTGPKGTGRRKLVIVSGPGKLAQTPPLGWNSWNVWATSVDTNKVKAAADSFISTGLAAHGFSYVNIDDGWEGKRDGQGLVLTNEKFGDMKGLADYVHSKGLKLGIYSSPGPKTCAGYEGSFGHEAQDANQYADWGIDYLKYDWCSYSQVTPANDRNAHIWPYRVMQRALDAAPRDIVYSLCQYGMSQVWEWGAYVNGNAWRTTGDITDTWRSMSGIGFSQDGHDKFAGPGRWNDPDMLVVGKLGWGPSLHATRLLPNEQITHITLWSLLASPLLIGCDLTQIDPFTHALLTNDEVLDVSQDPLGKQARRISRNGSVEVWARPLFDGTIAIGLFNRGATTADVTARWSDLGVKGNQPVRNLWLRKSLGNASDAYSAKVPGHGALLLKIGTPTRTEYTL